MTRGPAQPVAASVLGIERSIAGRRWVSRLDGGGDLRALAIAQAHGLPDLVARVLSSRGVDVASCPSYLDPTLRSAMPDPDALAGMAAAVARLEAAVVAGEALTVLGDYDVDGAASTALMVEYLTAAGVPCRFHIPDRLRDGYGPSIGAVDRIAASGARLLVTVDCGSSSHEALRHAAALGIDAVVIDHHGLSLPFPPAVAIVNPKRPDDLSGLDYLCAAGVVFMVLVALHRRLRQHGFWSGRREPDLLAGLDLVALGTVADVVPLVGLNRALVVKGLKVMRRRERAGLAALFDAAGAKGPPTVHGLGFIVGPRINAGGRIGDAALGTRLLLTRDPTEATAVAAELDGLNRDRRTIEADAVAQAEADALAMLGSAPPGADAAGTVLVVARPDWHPGVVGLVAARLKERFGRPVFALALGHETATGSGRSVPGVDLGRAVRAALEAGILRKGGGHAMAAGVTVETGRLEAFRTFLAEALAEDGTGIGEAEPLLVDATLNCAAAAAPELLAAIVPAGPFGSGSPDPIVAIPHGRVLDLCRIGENHLRFSLAGADGSRLRVTAFRVAGTPLGAGLMEAEGRLIHCVGTLAANSWSGGAARTELHLLDAAFPPLEAERAVLHARASDRIDPALRRRTMPGVPAPIV